MIDKFRILFFISLLFSAGLQACTFPGGGPFFDNLIKITELNSKNQFQVEIPRKLEELDLEVAYVGLDYTEISENDRLQEYDEKNHIGYYSFSYLRYFLDLILFRDRKNLILDFKAEYRLGYTPQITVRWDAPSCCLCSSYGYSSDFKLIQ